LYADDLVVIAETEEGLIKRLNEWEDNALASDVLHLSYPWYYLYLLSCLYSTHYPSIHIK